MIPIRINQCTRNIRVLRLQMINLNLHDLFVTILSKLEDGVNDLNEVKF